MILKPQNTFATCYCTVKIIQLQAWFDWVSFKGADILKLEKDSKFEKSQAKTITFGTDLYKYFLQYHLPTEDFWLDKGVKNVIFEIKSNYFIFLKTFSWTTNYILT